jgi:hypothetical protein
MSSSGLLSAEMMMMMNTEELDGPAINALGMRLQKLCNDRKDPTIYYLKLLRLFISSFVSTHQSARSPHDGFWCNP